MVTFSEKLEVHEVDEDLITNNDKTNMGRKEDVNDEDDDDIVEITQGDEGVSPRSHHRPVGSNEDVGGGGGGGGGDERSGEREREKLMGNIKSIKASILC